MEMGILDFLYGIGHKINTKRQLDHLKRLDVPVISIGNITLV